MTAVISVRWHADTFTAKLYSATGPWKSWACCVKSNVQKNQSCHDSQVCPEAPGQRHCSTQHDCHSSGRANCLRAVQSRAGQNKPGSGEVKSIRTDTRSQAGGMPFLN